MKVTILKPSTYKSTPWKNGQGATLELAINDGGRLDNFDWRISIASVNQNGPFSDFSDYQRNLILIKGNGILLEHASGTVDMLERTLQKAEFDGGVPTQGKLINGPIKDLNIMCHKARYKATVKTWKGCSNTKISLSNIAFLYCLEEIGNITFKHRLKSYQLEAGELAKFTPTENNERCNEESITLNGKNIILATFHPLVT
jgi:uncharacterized protein